MDTIDLAQFLHHWMAKKITRLAASKSINAPPEFHTNEKNRDIPTTFSRTTNERAARVLSSFQ
jgi:hypothetical protein